MISNEGENQLKSCWKQVHFVAVLAYLMKLFHLNLFVSSNSFLLLSSFALLLCSLTMFSDLKQALILSYPKSSGKEFGIANSLLAYLELFE